MSEDVPAGVVPFLPAGHRAYRAHRPAWPLRTTAASRPTDPAFDAADLADQVARVARGGARAAVLGINDGLVTNICLILGMAGAHASPGTVRLAGFASLLAGALSMAAGEWVSVRSQAELYGGLLVKIRQLVTRNPRLMLDELSSRLEAAGFARATAQSAPAELALDEERFLAFTAQIVFGISPAGLGSPLTAATTSLAYFAGGALIPLAPWWFLRGVPAVSVSIALTAIASILVGAGIARSSDHSMRRGALRQLAIILAAAAATYSIGKLFGSTVS
ncbi:VIT1/CCC1 transporter family protein [Pseudofrankia sp. BMG5.37]|uniref:VIT1/CCC1 transporter family protein n=1 Tax=Pseudofrankia sp. BMG5.37 TaxID=3050035 RepID=UPI002895E2C6|nr:VIT1/CCC1 transporter family protein [Pseudofrankia sp. BMG5.37]MDT3442006.1 VIT1/CCC1 transporter family protein [Pseudofrankia sp. BMG5.37]MDT3442546.1 VIT1/CCC1 transporter family protein [Pseudofrankia sp. BMG5.37]MDT3446091.1 VIT1/CCC1 transporter family protein [Pseudofrankia sp. BMG5.37]